MVAQRLKHLPALRETQVWSLDREDPLEKEMVTCSSTLAWRLPWREEPGRLQSTGLQRVGHVWATSLSLFMVTDANCIYCIDHFTVYTNIKSLCSTPEANAVFLCRLKKKAFDIHWHLWMLWLGRIRVIPPFSSQNWRNAKIHFRVAACYLAALTSKLELLVRAQFSGPVLALG